MRTRRSSGTSLVEILVVIVVFLVGILAIAQVFPGGFKAMSATQKNTIATSLARAEIERMKSHADQMPDAILFVRYILQGGLIKIEAEPDRFPNDIGPAYRGLDSTGTMYDQFNNAIGNWQYLVGANIGRRVVGEGKVIPAPRQIGGYYGSLLSLQFAPVVYNPGTYNPIFTVYGNDMNRREGDPVANGWNVRSTEFFVTNEDNPGAMLTLPANPTRIISYNVRLTYYVQNGPNIEAHTLVGQPVAVPAGGSPYQILVSDAQLANQAVLGIDYESVRVSRIFDDVTGLGPNDWGLGAGVPNPDPYEYKLVTPELGLVLFNPVGYDYTFRARGRREPLEGRVSYDVFDWRIIHDEFRAPSTAPYQYRLAITGLKVSGEVGPDFTTNQGIGITAPDSTGNPNSVDLVLQDVDTGGLFMYQDRTENPALTSYTVNKSTGLIKLLDADLGTPGLQMAVFYPGSAVPTLLTVDNRALRALYMGKNEWAVQVMKPSATYSQTWARPGIGEFYIGGSVSGDGANAARIYFPPADAGRVVSLGELYYVTAGGVQMGPVQLSGTVQANAMDIGGAGNGLPYIQVSDYLPNFGAFDYTYGTAVKSVKGASVAVRVFWNPDFFHLTNDPAINMNNLDKWMQGWRRTTVETYLQREN